MKRLIHAILRHYKYEESHWGVAYDGIHVRGLKHSVTAYYFKSDESVTMSSKDVERTRQQNKVKQLTLLT